MKDVMTFLLLSISLGRDTLSDLFEKFLKSATTGVDKEFKPLAGKSVTGRLTPSKKILLVLSNILQEEGVSDADYDKDILTLLKKHLALAVKNGISLTVFPDTSKSETSKVTAHDFGKFVQSIKTDDGSFNVLTCYVQGAGHLVPNFEYNELTKKFVYSLVQDEETIPCLKALKSGTLEAFLATPAANKVVEVGYGVANLSFPYKSEGEVKAATSELVEATAKLNKVSLI